jgi:hypothetical protein
MARSKAMDMPRDELSIGYRPDFTNIYIQRFGRLFFKGMIGYFPKKHFRESLPY